MHLSNNTLHIAKVIGAFLVVVMIWLTANRTSTPARYTNNQEKVSGNFYEGGAIGTWTWWYPNGRKMSEGEFVNGKRDGIWNTWYANGQKKSQATYKNDKLNGTYISWFENGKTKSIQIYKEDQLHGLQQYYDTVGLLIEEKIYIDGEEKEKSHTDKLNK